MTAAWTFATGPSPVRVSCQSEKRLVEGQTSGLARQNEPVAVVAVLRLHGNEGGLVAVGVSVNGVGTIPSQQSGHLLGLDAVRPQDVCSGTA